MFNGRAQKRRKFYHHKLYVQSAKERRSFSHNTYWHTTLGCERRTMNCNFHHPTVFHYQHRLLFISNYFSTFFIDNWISAWDRECERKLEFIARRNVPLSIIQDVESPLRVCGTTWGGIVDNLRMVWKNLNFFLNHHTNPIKK